MFRVFNEPLPVDRYLGCWAKHMGRFSQVAGYTSFGDLFLIDPTSGQYAVLCPLTGERFPTSCHDAETFRNGLLADPEIIDRFARPDDVAELCERVGALGDEEVYIPCPYPFLGGSGELTTYQKGRLWEFLHLVGQMRGLGEPGEVQVTVQSTHKALQRPGGPVDGTPS